MRVRPRIPDRTLLRVRHTSSLVLIHLVSHHEDRICCAGLSRLPSQVIVAEMVRFELTKHVVNVLTFLAGRWFQPLTHISK